MQHTSEATRNQYLLALTLSNVNGIKVNTVPCIVDHKGLLIEMPASKRNFRSIQREDWIYKAANWTQLTKVLAEWNRHQLEEGSADDAAHYFFEELWMHLVEYIPRRNFEEKKDSQPWSNKRCEHAIARSSNLKEAQNIQATVMHAQTY